MKERPILFSAPMVRAILDGNKTQTRRICKPAQFFSLSNVVEVPDPQERGQVYNGSHFGDEDGEVQFACPYGGRGERLWVRETWATHWMYNDVPPSISRSQREDLRPTDNRWFRADGEDALSQLGRGSGMRGKWRPSIHMPRWASRITLEVTGVRVERLQDISEADAINEGVEPWACCPPSWDGDGWWRDYSLTPSQEYAGDEPMTSARDSYRTLWESINGPGSWAANPWVWVIEFKRVLR